MDKFLEAKSKLGEHKSAKQRRRANKAAKNADKRWYQPQPQAQQQQQQFSWESFSASERFPHQEPRHEPAVVVPAPAAPTATVAQELQQDNPASHAVEQQQGKPETITVEQPQEVQLQAVDEAKATDDDGGEEQQHQDL